MPGHALRAGFERLSRPTSLTSPGPVTPCKRSSMLLEAAAVTGGLLLRRALRVRWDDEDDHFFCPTLGLPLLLDPAVTPPAIDAGSGALAVATVPYRVRLYAPQERNWPAYTAGAALAWLLVLVVQRLARGRRSVCAARRVGDRVDLISQRPNARDRSAWVRMDAPPVTPRSVRALAGRCLDRMMAHDKHGGRITTVATVVVNHVAHPVAK